MCEAKEQQLKEGTLIICLHPQQIFYLIIIIIIIKIMHTYYTSIISEAGAGYTQDQCSPKQEIPTTNKAPLS